MSRKLKSKTVEESARISIWKVAGRPVTIDEFIEEGSNRLDAIGFRQSRRALIGRLHHKLLNSDFGNVSRIGRSSRTDY